MKAAEPHAETTESKTGRNRRATVPTIPSEGRRSTVAALLKHAPGWAGHDLEEVIAIVKSTRTKTRF
jgi:hypothetical protein